MTSISNIIIIILHNLRCIRKHYERVYCTGLIFMKTSFNVISILNPFIVSLRLASQHFCFAAPICYNNNNISAIVSFVCFPAYIGHITVYTTAVQFRSKQPDFSMLIDMLSNFMLRSDTPTREVEVSCWVQFCCCKLLIILWC